MGMQAHLVALDASSGIDTGQLNDDEIYALLTGPDAVDIDKSWEAAFPLIGAIADTGMLLASDPVPVGSDLGFGPAMFIEADQVAMISSRLSDTDAAALDEHWSRLDSPFMPDDVYGDDDGKEFALLGYHKTAEVFAAATAASRGVLFAIM